MSQDRLLELIIKEFLDELEAEEADELKILCQYKPFQDRYDLFKTYLSRHQTDLTANESAFKKVQQKIAYQNETPLYPANATPSKRAIYWKIAGVIVGALCALGVLLWHQREMPVNQIAYTKPASKRTLVLPDGTKVVLNAASKLYYPKTFQGKSRKVTLIGEAYFDVAQNAQYPFVIHTDKMDVKVLGTTFNLKSYPDDKFSEATLLTGAIQVTLKDRPTDRITLKPSEKLIVKNQVSSENTIEVSLDNDALAQITHFQRSDTSIIETSWMYNQVVFKEETFATISNILERAYGVQIDFRNRDLELLRFTGHFEKESITDVLQALSLVEPFSYKIQDKKIVIE